MNSRFKAQEAANRWNSGWETELCQSTVRPETGKIILAEPLGRAVEAGAAEGRPKRKNRADEAKWLDRPETLAKIFVSH
jgi:hypothetical protein